MTGNGACGRASRVWEEAAAGGGGGGGGGGDAASPGS